MTLFVFFFRVGTLPLCYQNEGRVALTSKAAKNKFHKRLDLYNHPLLPLQYQNKQRERVHRTPYVMLYVTFKTTIGAQTFEQAFADHDPADAVRFLTEVQFGPGATRDSFYPYEFQTINTPSYPITAPGYGDLLTYQVANEDNPNAPVPYFTYTGLLVAPEGGKQFYESLDELKAFIAEHLYKGDNA